MSQSLPKNKVLEEYRLRRLEKALAAYIAEEKASASQLAMVISVYFETEIPVNALLRARRSAETKIKNAQKQAALINSFQAKTHY